MPRPGTLRAPRHRKCAGSRPRFGARRGRSDRRDDRRAREV